MHSTMYLRLEQGTDHKLVFNPLLTRCRPQDHVSHLSWCCIGRRCRRLSRGGAGRGFDSWGLDSCRAAGSQGSVVGLALLGSLGVTGLHCCLYMTCYGGCIPCKANGRHDEPAVSVCDLLAPNSIPSLLEDLCTLHPLKGNAHGHTACNEAVMCHLPRVDHGAIDRSNNSSFGWQCRLCIG